MPKLYLPKNYFSKTQDITSEFVDGIYSFDVRYTDTTTDRVDVQLGGVFPIFPTSLSLTGNTVTWDSWLNSVFPSHIEFVISELGGGDSMDAFLAYTETSYTLPTDFLKNNAQYDIELWFVSSEHPGGFKSSVSTLTTVPVPSTIFLLCSGMLGLISFGRRYT